MSLDRKLGQYSLHLMDRLGLAYVNHVTVTYTHLIKHMLPVNTLEILLEGIESHLVVVGCRITLLDGAV